MASSVYVIASLSTVHVAETEGIWQLWSCLDGTAVFA